jgi:hypothetical protein
LRPGCDVMRPPSWLCRPRTVYSCGTEVAAGPRSKKNLTSPLNVSPRSSSYQFCLDTPGGNSMRTGIRLIITGGREAKEMESVWAAFSSWLEVPQPPTTAGRWEVSRRASSGVSVGGGDIAAWSPAGFEACICCIHGLATFPNLLSL